jgi:hypothetical protein
MITPSAGQDTPSRSDRAGCVHRASGSRPSGLTTISTYCPCGRVARSAFRRDSRPAGAVGAFDVEHVELAFDVAKDGGSEILTGCSHW